MGWSRERTRHIFDDADAAIGLTREGFGFGWGPAWLVGDDLREGRMVEVLRDWRVPEEPHHRPKG